MSKKKTLEELRAERERVEALDHAHKLGYYQGYRAAVEGELGRIGRIIKELGEINGARG